MARRRRRKIGQNKESDLATSRSSIFVTPVPRHMKRVNLNKRRKKTEKSPEMSPVITFKRTNEDYTPETTKPQRFKPTPFIHL